MTKQWSAAGARRAIGARSTAPEHATAGTSVKIHVWAAVTISCGALGLSLAALSLALITLVR
jgi:hypothetical protein